MAVVGSFSQLYQFEFGGAPLEDIHHFGESGHQVGGSEFGGASLWQTFCGVELFSVNLELGELSQTGPESGV